MSSVILANGKTPSKALVQKYCADAELIICTDGALSYALQYDIKPHILVGDMDSLVGFSEADIQNLDFEIIKYPTEKDITDAEIAVDHIMDRGFKRVIILGATGNRLDHTLGNFQLLYKLACNGIEAFIIDENETITMAQGNFSFIGEKGALLSLVPYNDKVFIQSTQGLYYPIHQRYLPIDSTYSISNVLIDDNVSINITEGKALLFYYPKNQGNA